MTLINVLGLVITAIILIAGSIVKRIFRRKMENLDGFCGIVQKREILPQKEQIPTDS